MQFLKNLKDYWFLYTLAGGAAIWIATINSRIFDSPEQKVEFETYHKTALTPLQQQKKYMLDSMRFHMDSIDKASASRKRELTLKRDSVERERRRVQDSFNYDLFQRVGVQVEQMKARQDSLIKLR